MTAPLRHPAGKDDGLPAAADRRPDVVRAATDVVLGWTGDDLVALLLSGSHATGEAVWIRHDGRTVALSDVDLYAVLTSPEACRRAEERAANGRESAASRLRQAGLEAPLEVGFLTREGVARMAARPGTVELARHGVVVAGDASVLARVPRPAPGEVPREEASLLLENRGLELLLAWPRLASRDALERGRARHGTLKAVADLATVLALGAGELPDGTAARIEFALDRLPFLLPSRLPADFADGAAHLERLWRVAQAWRRGGGDVPAESAARQEWRAATAAWCAVWWTWFEDGSGDPWSRALHAAARAPLRRRLRRGLGGGGRPLRRVRLAIAGTPQHRVNASAAVLLLAASAGEVPALSAGALRALSALGVCAATEWEPARREVAHAWNTLVMRGQREDDAR